jgi:uncharacterized protein
LRPLYFWLCLITWPFALTSTASAASFNCAKAQTTSEKAICGDAELSAADEKMAIAYRESVTQEPADVKAVLMENQRSWLRFTHRYCGSAQRQMHQAGAYDKRQETACLKHEYKTRILALPNSIRDFQSSFRIYAIERLDVYPIKTIMEGDEADKLGRDDLREPATHVLSVDQVVASTPEERRLNAFLRSLAGLDKIRTASQKKSDDEDGGQSEDETHYTIVAASKALIVVDSTNAYFGYGAAHPIGGGTTVYFLMAEGIEMPANRVFADTNPWKAFLAQRCFDELTKRGIITKDNVFVKSVDDLMDKVIDPGHWDFGATGLTINFGLYEVAPYSVGGSEVEIPWADLRPYLVKDSPIFGLARVPAAARP